MVFFWKLFMLLATKKDISIEKKNMAELRPVGTQACKDDFED